MSTYRNTLNRKVTPQSQPIPGSDQVKNNAGGYAFQIDMWKRLERFLILGSEGGTYYVNERNLTMDNAQNLLNCIKTDGKRAVDTIVAISDEGRAVKNTPAIFALAVCASYGDAETKSYALSQLSKVARIGTHLFEFVGIVDGMRGWGRGLRSAVSSWYNDKNPQQLAYQLVKYQQRNGWSHRDVLRLAHATPKSDAHNRVLGWSVRGYTEDTGVNIIEGFELAKRAENEAQIVNLISDFGLTREMIPTQFLNSVDVWNALLQKMPMTAMIRNLGKMTSVGLLSPMGEPAKLVVSRLMDKEYLQKSRVHPLSVYVAMKTYNVGRGFRGSLSWNTNAQISEALDRAFYLAFQNVEPTGKNFYLGLDVSGSMSVGIAGLPYVSAREATALMSMVTVRSEKNFVTKAFTANGASYGQGRSWNRGGIENFPIHARMSLEQVAQKMSRMPFGGTDCSLPMLDATHNKIPVDTFVVYTDSETWAGNIHPVQALKQYRDKMGIPAKLIVVGMTATRFSIADPNDAGMLDVVGFDTATPRVISEFAKE